MHYKDRCTYVKSEDISKYLKDGWAFGKGRIYINDGIINKQVTKEQYSKMDQNIWKRGLHRGK